MPERFNIDEDGQNKVDDRSPDRGPEPEGVVVGRVGDVDLCVRRLGTHQRRCGVRRDRPAEAKLIDVVPLALDAKMRRAGRTSRRKDCAFVPADRSPTGEPLLAVACEVTGTTILFRVDSVPDK